MKDRRIHSATLALVLVLDFALVLVVLVLLVVVFLVSLVSVFVVVVVVMVVFFCNSRVNAMSSIIRSSICHSSRESQMFT